MKRKWFLGSEETDMQSHRHGCATEAWFVVEEGREGITTKSSVSVCLIRTLFSCGNQN